MPELKAETSKLTPEMWHPRWTGCGPNWVEARLRAIDSRCRLKQTQDGFWGVYIKDPAAMIDHVPGTEYYLLWLCKGEKGERREPSRLDINNLHRCRRIDEIRRETREAAIRRRETMARDGRNAAEAYGAEDAHAFMVATGARPKYVRGTEFTK